MDNTEMDTLDQAVGIIHRVLGHHLIQVEQILLFGSRARGEACSDSDWDFYVLINPALSFPQRQRITTEIKRRLAKAHIPNDVILKSAEQFNLMKPFPGHLAYEVAHEGVPIDEYAP
jgi:predicted nucleotidyltransferase